MMNQCKKFSLPFENVYTYLNIAANEVMSSFNLSQGTVEAIREVLKVLPQDTVSLRMLMQAVGDVTISDVDLAVASEGIIIAFNVGVSAAVQSYADDKGVEIRSYKVIYDLIDDIRNAMEGLLDVAQVSYGHLA